MTRIAPRRSQTDQLLLHLDQADEGCPEESIARLSAIRTVDSPLRATFMGKAHLRLVAPARKRTIIQGPTNPRGPDRARTRSSATNFVPFEEPKSPFLFTCKRGAPFTTDGFARMVERAGACAKLGLKVHPHMLRRLQLCVKPTRVTTRGRFERTFGTASCGFRASGSIYVYGAFAGTG